MEQRNILEWSEHSEYTELTIPSGEIWMSESELVDLFGVFIPKLRNTIQTLYKEELVRPYEAERRMDYHLCRSTQLLPSVHRNMSMRRSGLP